ncbi:MAG: phage virion morphogenesis protein [Thermodesulfobacteriota bacterium]
MAGIRLKIDQAEVERFAGVTLGRFGNLQPLHERIAVLMASSIRENFEAGGRPAEWKQSRRAKQQRGQTLRDTNRLMNSIAGRGYADKAVAGTNDVRAAVHQFGAKRGQFGTMQAAVRAHVRKIRGKEQQVRQHTRKQPMPWGDIPARPFMLLQTEDVAEIKTMVGAYLTGRSR